MCEDVAQEIEIWAESAACSRPQQTYEDNAFDSFTWNYLQPQIVPKCRLDYSMINEAGA